MMMACMGGHADVLKLLVEEFGMKTDISDLVSQFIHSIILRLSHRVHTFC